MAVLMEWDTDLLMECLVATTKLLCDLVGKLGIHLGWPLYGHSAASGGFK